MREAEDSEPASISEHMLAIARRWRFSLRMLLIFTTLLSALIAIIANYPLVALFLAGVVSTLMFLQLAVFFASLAVLRFWRVWPSFDAGDSIEGATSADES
jgi:hypothetical protein